MNTVKQVYIRRISDKGLRHKTNVTPDQYKQSFLEIGRQFGYATRDHSWGELEKLISIMACRLVDYEVMEFRNAER